MNYRSISPKALLLLAALAVPVASGASAQQTSAAEGEVLTTVYGSPPVDLSGLAEGPEVEGIISARSGDRILVTVADGTSRTIRISRKPACSASRTRTGADLCHWTTLPTPGVSPTSTH